MSAGLAVDLAELVFDLAAAGFHGSGKARIETPQFRTQTRQSGGSGGLSPLYVGTQFRRYEPRTNRLPQTGLGREQICRRQTIALHPLGAALVENGEPGAREGHRLASQKLFVEHLRLREVSQFSRSTNIGGRGQHVVLSNRAQQCVGRKKFGAVHQFRGGDLALACEEGAARLL